MLRGESVVSLAQQLLGKPNPVGEIGRFVKLLDGPSDEPNPMGLAMAMEYARGWVETPCRPELQPVRDVLATLLNHIDNLERQE